MTHPSTGRYLPNRLVSHFRQALAESIGRTAAEHLWRDVCPHDADPAALSTDLEKSVDFACFSGLCGAVTGVYGRNGARSILYRCGRSAFAKTLTSSSAIVGLEGPHFHTPSASDRITEGLSATVRFLNLLTDMECAAEAEGREYLFRCAACPECVGRDRGEGICFGTAGLFRGALDWFGIDPEFPVMETSCGPDGCAFSSSTAV